MPVEQQELGFAREVDAGSPNPYKSIQARLHAATRPDMVEIAPGKFAPKDGAQAPEMCIASWKRESDGTYRAVPVCERMVKLTSKLTRMLGFPGQFETIRRLGRAGYIECIKVTPQIYLLNLDSWYNHLRRCAEDPEFWDSDGKNLKEYRQAQGWIDPSARKTASGRKGRKAPGRRF